MRSLPTLRLGLKASLMIIALLIGTSTVLYTNILVAQLAEREVQLIDLYAKAIEAATHPESGGNLSFISEQIIVANNSIPVILTDENEMPISDVNLDVPKDLEGEKLQAFLKEEIAEMKEQHPPIVVDFGEGLRNYIFYKESALLTQLRYYPYVQLLILGCFAALAYFAFSFSRKAEQNRVWVGLAKETAHQLGTPLSSLMAWNEYLKSNPKFEGKPILGELDKDIRRLEIITERFSNIGSVPALKDEDILKATSQAIGYLEGRVSKKVNITIRSSLDPGTPARINTPLFEWVIENITKNAIDAMEGKGDITLFLSAANNNQIALDIRDTGKGIAKANLEDVFKPGYTTKKRGWGLGLALARRIIENYHQGRLYVKWSEVGKGTMFRILLNRE